jgi:hypothetical protein
MEERSDHVSGRGREWKREVDMYPDVGAGSASAAGMDFDTSGPWETQTTRKECVRERESRGREGGTTTRPCDDAPSRTGRVGADALRSIGGCRSVSGCGCPRTSEELSTARWFRRLPA